MENNELLNLIKQILTSEEKVNRGQQEKASVIQQQKEAEENILKNVHKTLDEDKYYNGLTELMSTLRKEIDGQQRKYQNFVLDEDENWELQYYYPEIEKEVLPIVLNLQEKLENIKKLREAIYKEAKDEERKKNEGLLNELQKKIFLKENSEKLLKNNYERKYKEFLRLLEEDKKLKEKKRMINNIKEAINKVINHPYIEIVPSIEDDLPVFNINIEYDVETKREIEEEEYQASIFGTESELENLIENQLGEFEVNLSDKKLDNLTPIKYTMDKIDVDKYRYHEDEGDYFTGEMTAYTTVKIKIKIKEV